MFSTISSFLSLHSKILSDSIFSHLPNTCPTRLPRNWWQDPGVPTQGKLWSNSVNGGQHFGKPHILSWGFLALYPIANSGSQTLLYSSIISLGGIRFSEKFKKKEALSWLWDFQSLCHLGPDGMQGLASMVHEWKRMISASHYPSHHHIFNSLEQILLSWRKRKEIKER